MSWKQRTEGFKSHLEHKSLTEVLNIYDANNTLKLQQKNECNSVRESASHSALNLEQPLTPSMFTVVKTDMWPV